jgi:hypothetical protein
VFKADLHLPQVALTADELLFRRATAREMAGKEPLHAATRTRVVGGHETAYQLANCPTWRDRRSNLARTALVA